MMNLAILNQNDEGDLLIRRNLHNDEAKPLESVLPDCG